MTVYDVVKKLIGEIDPVGETNTDNKRFENLKQMTNLVDEILKDINYVSRSKDSHEYSRKKAGEYAVNAIKNIHDWSGEE